jgi:hypothetical protein
MPKYYHAITKEIIEYPADAAALFSVLKPVPSEKAKVDKKVDEEKASKTETVKHAQ